jgi:hypothetical protein
VQHAAILESTLAVTKRPYRAAYLSRCIEWGLPPSLRRNALAACPPEGCSLKLYPLVVCKS